MIDEKYFREMLRCPLFERMDTTEAINLMAPADHRIIELQRDEIHLLEGEHHRNLEIILAGELRTRMLSPTGKSLQMTRLSAGDVIAPAFIYSNNNGMPVEVEAVCNSVLLRIPGDVFQQLIDNNATIRWNFIRLISTKCENLTHRLRLASLYSVEEKVRHMLDLLVRKQYSMTITLDKSRQEIADMFGIQKYSLQRCLTELAARGEIILEGKRITLTPQYGKHRT